MVATTKSKINFIAEIGINHLGSIDLAKKIFTRQKIRCYYCKISDYITEKRVSTDSPIFQSLRIVNYPLILLLSLKTIVMI